jgi:integrase
LSWTDGVETMKAKPKSPSYLVRNPHSYCFRMVVPKDLQKFVGKRELRYTLRTGYAGIARQKALFVASKIHFIFRTIRRGVAALKNLTNDQIKVLIDQYIKDAIKSWDEQFYEDVDKDEYPLPYVDEAGFHGYLQELDFIRDDLIANLNLCDFSMLRNSIHDLLKKNGIADPDTSSPEYRRLSAEIHKAEIQLIAFQKRHMLCDFSYKKELPEVFPESFDQAVEPPSVIGSLVTEKSSESLKTVVGAFWKERGPNWKKRTAVEYSTCRKYLLDFLGAETPIHRIDYPKARDYKTLLAEKGTKNGKALSAGRINMYLGFASTLFNFAKQNHYTDINPFERIQIKEKKTRVDELRDVFDEQDLVKLFCSSKEYSEDTHTHPHNFWVPILGLYTGCRLEELCQLYVQDVIKHDGIWCLKIEEDKPDKSVKTGEKRLVPLHPFIIDQLNFTGYISSLPDQAGRLFPKLKRINHRYGHNIGRWFGDFKQRCGIESPPRKKSFHSFRHTFINHLKQKGVQEAYIAEFVGHTNASITMERYGKRYEVAKLTEQIIKNLDYGIDLSHLKESKWVVK